MREGSTSKQGMSRERTDSYPPCSVCGKPGHVDKFCWKVHKCRICNKVGHHEKHCFNNRSNQTPVRYQPRNHHQQASLATEKKVDDHLFLAFHMTNTVEADLWFIDSACTNHMTSKEEIFCNLNPDCKVTIKMGNGEVVPAKGVGTIAIQTKKGMKYIDNILLVAGLSSNLLSVGQIV